MALNPDNKETLVNEKVAKSLGEKKIKWARNLRVYDGAGKGERKQAFIKRLLYTTYITRVTTFNSHNNPRRWV